MLNNLGQIGTVWDKLGQIGTTWDRLGQIGTCSKLNLTYIFGIFSHLTEQKFQEIDKLNANSDYLCLWFK